jgi:NAD(P)-dependent dehydrogenase (short-subunit alcohol dehydrogenase family)
MEDRIAEACVNTYGGADVLINNAGAGFPAVAAEDIKAINGLNKNQNNLVDSDYMYF